MTNDEKTIDLLTQAADEIAGLRRHIADITPHAEAFAVIRELIEIIRPAERGTAPFDIEWQLRREIDHMIDGRREEKHAEAAE